MLPYALPPPEVLSPLFSAASAARSITSRDEGAYLGPPYRVLHLHDRRALVGRAAKERHGPTTALTWGAFATTAPDSAWPRGTGRP